MTTKRLAIAAIKVDVLPGMNIVKKITRSKPPVEIEYPGK
jgi:hypothetical protein